ncbi:MAG: hypothetical protein PHR94_05865 [Methylomonas lenta]|nr:hypothetical protein [Methylomonas lenta]
MSIWSWIMRLTGWSPVGKIVEIQIDESQFPSLLGKNLTAKIESLCANGAAVLNLIEPINSIQMIIVHPRHKGYDFFHLRVGAIAVSLSSYIENQPMLINDSRFAMGVIRFVGTNSVA